MRVENVLNISLENFLKMSSKRLENKTILQDVLKTFWRRLENVLARRLKDVLKKFL